MREHSSEARSVSCSPGTLKNALDWLAGSTDIVEKPVALLSGSARSTHAQESLAVILKTIELIGPGDSFMQLSGRRGDEVALAIDQVERGPVAIAERVPVREVRIEYDGIRDVESLDGLPNVLRVLLLG